MRCKPWHDRDRVVLVGDAAHAIVPFYGQGMNAGFEDCRIFDELLDEHGPQWSVVLPAYTEERKPNGDAIADMALANFIEMRDHVGSPLFLWWKRCEKLLHRLFPGWFTPLYNLVTFSNVPYAEARAQARSRLRTLGVAAAVTGALLLVLAVALLKRITTT